MRKTLRNIALAIAIICTGTITTSCDSNTIAQLFPIISSLFNTGQTYTFTGKGTTQTNTGSYEKNNWTQLTDTIEYNPMQVQLQCTETGTLTTPALTYENINISEISISALSLTASSDQSYTILALTEASRISGTITIGNTAYEASAVYIDTAAATEEEIVLKITLYFQADNETEYTKAVNLTFTGKAATE